MPLFVVRPSRGTWGFFGLVLLGVMGVRAMNKHDAKVVRQDRPATEHAQSLSACLLGVHARWVLRAPDDPDAQLRWTYDIGRVFRATASQAQPEEWPGVCTEPARALISSLQRASTSNPAVRALAAETRNLVDRAGNSTEERLALADNEQLASRLAALLLQVRALSAGSRSSWDAGFRGAAPPVVLTLASLPALRGLPGEVVQPVLVSAQSALARGTWNGYGQVLRLDGAAPRRVLLESFTPLAEAPHGGLARVWTDDGPRIVDLLPGPRVLRPPGDLALRDPAGFRWSARRHGDARVMLTLDDGDLQARVHRPQRPEAWSPAAAVGPSQSILAATLTDAATPDAPWRVTTLRPRFSDVVLEQYTVSPDGDGLRVGAAMPLYTREPLPGALPAVETCESHDVAYFVLAERSAVTAVRVHEGVAQTATARLSLPRGARLRLQCDAQQVLAAPTPAGALAGAALFRFEGGAAGTGTLLEHPPAGTNEVHAMVLARDAVLAFASSPGALRVWRLRPPMGFFGRGASRWEHGAMLLDLLATPRVRRRVTSMQAMSDGDRVTLLIELAHGDRVMRAQPAEQPMAPLDEAPTPRFSAAGRAVLTSRDGGRTFAAPY
jgi:hypothetical protein